MSEVTVTLKTEQMMAFNEVCSLMQLGKMPDAWAKFQQYAVTLGNMGGRFNQALQGPDVPDLGAIADGDYTRHTFSGFGSWQITNSRRVSVRVYEFGGPTAQRIVSDGTREDGIMLVLDPGTNRVKTWIVNPDPGVSYGSAMEVQPA